MWSACFIVLIVAVVTMVAGRSLDENDLSHFNALTERFNDESNQFARQDDYETLVKRFRSLMKKRVSLSKSHLFTKRVLCCLEKIV